MKYIIILWLIIASLLLAGEINTIDDRSINLKIKTFTWDTNWNKHTINYKELLSGGPPRDGIPPIDKAKFVGISEAKKWLKDQEPIVFVKINNEVKAYPIQILIWHEIVNDTLANKDISVTFCPLCNSTIVFNRQINGRVYDFGTSGLLRNSDLVMYDRQTQSLWQQFTGLAIVGDMTGTQIEILPSSMISFKDFYLQYENGLVLSKDTGYNRAYGSNPYVGYDNINSSPFLYKDDIDSRLKPMQRVVTISNNDINKAYSYSIIKDKKIINDKINSDNIVLFYKKGKVSALDSSNISSSKDVGSVTVYNRALNNEILEFYYDKEKGFIDKQTNSIWNIFGQAISGELKGEVLKEVIHADHFWFSWVVFKPNTLIYK